ncbi:S-adenosyl-L-methionine-dependent methyltransferase [Xylogone sp. PMI_703]|nr:S-adenosyl-L-methionine-dependent methyltransferase [Xylogone sp. PMI_703]
MGRGGKRGGRGGGKGRGGRGGGGRGHGEDNRVNFNIVEKRNEKLENFYNSVLGLPEDEKADFWAALKRELPNSFRFAGSRGHALAVQKLLKERYIPEISKISHYDGTPVEPPKVVPWYPDELAWWMTTPKNVVRRFPPFAAFQKYLVSETSVGNISRQEVVSMIPPLVIDLQPGMTVLDMCAAPGSKAAQLLEMVHRGEEARVHKALQKFAKEDGRESSPGAQGTGEGAEELDVDSSDYGRATGMLIANDSDYKRSHMLIHQLKRLSSPNLIVTNHDATMYPSIKLPSTPENPSHNRYLKFDRILADVPCSGDGTLRKNVTLWKDWNPTNALGLHMTQVRILVRALQMLKVGGRVVYSTCSMNPVENEAVISSAIERCGGLDKVQLLPSDDKLPLLKRKPGLKSWSIMDKSGRVWNSWEEVQQEVAANGSNVYTDRLSEGMFTPPSGSPASQIPFERCMRVYAHQQDTGGFFIAILEKKTEFKAKPESEPKKNQTPAQTEAPITAIVDAIESSATPANGESVLPHIEAADALTHPQAHNPLDDASPAAIQNQPFDPPLTAAKRAASEVEDKEIDALERGKRLKVEEDEAIAYASINEREVHYPPPPGAELDRTAHKSEESKATPDMSHLASRPVKVKSGQQFEEPFKYISPDHPEVQTVANFYNLSPRFPRDRFLVRNAMGDPVKTIYYTSALIRDILTENEGKGIKFVHAGVKMFMRQDVQAEGVCKWRIQSEGMPILEGYVGEERVVRLYKKETLRKLLIEMFPKVSDGAWKELGEIGEHVNKIGMGCCVLRIEPSDDEDGFSERMVLPLWRSLHSLNLMLAKEDRTAMLLRLYNDTTPLLNNSKSARRDAKDKEDAKEDKTNGKEEDVMSEAGEEAPVPSDTNGAANEAEVATEAASEA